jgi:DMSO/TMAO reductase YedYZ molybdopterin-dependent catalytic subunit
VSRFDPDVERSYDDLRARQWLSGESRGDDFSRRDLFRLAAAMGAVATGVGSAAAPAQAADPGAGPTSSAGPILKPLPPELFVGLGSNAEMRWEAMAGQGYLVPTDRFFVRNHTATPLLDVDTWRLRLLGTGLRGSPGADGAIELSYQQLRRFPTHSQTSLVECAGNGRSFFTSQQGQSVSGTAWRLGAVGVARWRGVRLSTVLRHAGLTPDAVDVLPQGLDADFVTGGVNLGPVRRPLPIGKALDDVLVAYEMNGAPLPPDHGFPVRLVVPGWIGISSIKWLGSIEVSAEPLFSPWNTQFYRLFGPGYPGGGTLVGGQVVKSAFELAWNAHIPAGTRTVLRGRSWSGAAPIRGVEVSTDGGLTWRRARLHRADTGRAWQRWELSWRPTTPGPATLRARAVDATGARQPEEARYNTLGYLFDGVVEHPVAVV